MENVGIMTSHEPSVDKDTSNVSTSLIGPPRQGWRQAHEPKVYVRRKGPKRKRLEEVVDNSITKDGEENAYEISPSEKSPKNNAHIDPVDADEVTPVRELGKAAARRTAALPMPKNDILEYILNKLQERDTSYLFTHPVERNEVEDYYQIISNPMDFGTLRKNLSDGHYKSLDEFEHDVLLIFKNAMEYNSKRFVYFRQARQIHELAKTYFRKLKTDISKVMEEFEEQSNKASTSSRRTRAKRRPTTTKTNYQTELLDDAYKRRETWKPKRLEDEENALMFLSNGAQGKRLIPGNGGICYKQSLEHFAQDLGPAAKKFAQQKLSMLGTFHNIPHLAVTRDEPEPEPEHVSVLDNRRILNSIARRGNIIPIQDFTNSSSNGNGKGVLTHPSREINPVARTCINPNFRSQQNRNEANLHLSYVGYRGFNSTATDWRGKQVVAEGHGNDQLQQQQQHPQSQRASISSNYSSVGAASLLDFWSRNSSRQQAKPSHVHPSTVIMPASRLRQTNNTSFPVIGSSSNYTTLLQQQTWKAASSAATPPRNPSGCNPFSFMQLLMNEDESTVEKLALQQNTWQNGASYSSSSSFSMVMNENEGSRNYHQQGQNRNSLSYMELLMGEGDTYVHEMALMEEMKGERGNN